jgi:hypothetical protein
VRGVAHVEGVHNRRQLVLPPHKTTMMTEQGHRGGKRRQVLTSAAEE